MTNLSKREIKETDSESESTKVRNFYPEFTQRLKERRDDLLGRTNVERTHLDEQFMTAPGDAADVSVIDTSADYFLKLANSHQHELIEIRDAFERMNRGVYGICENCDNEISIERLRKLPFARLCIDCQVVQEKATSKVRSIPKL